jgi:NAD(P)H dehydrogenase (quinone)
MPNILALYFSTFGHIAAMTHAAAVGARDLGATVTVKKVADFRTTDQPDPESRSAILGDEIADPRELENYDGFIVGVSTRFGIINAPLKHFFDQTFPLWARGVLIDKPVTIMSSAANQHGGLEAAILSTQAMLQHHGMLIVPLSYSYAE